MKNAAKKQLREKAKDHKTTMGGSCGYQYYKWETVYPGILTS